MWSLPAATSTRTTATSAARRHRRLGQGVRGGRRGDLLVMQAGALLHEAEVIVHGWERTMADWMMDGARELAWIFANHLSPRSGKDRELAISKRDEEATLLADAVLLTCHG